jgi:histone chaperone ASF1
LIPETDLIGVTVVLIVCSYNEQEFVRVGYYVNNEYEDPEMRENPPEKVDLTKVTRNILSEKPRVTRVPIRWDNLDENPEPVQDDFAEEGEDFIKNYTNSFNQESFQKEMEA